MNNSATYFKYSVLLIIAIGIFWLVRNCNHTAGKETATIKYDTVYQKQLDTVLIDNPVPYKITYYKEKVLHDTLETVETILQNVDSAKILAQYLAVRDYDTTIPVKYGGLKLSAEITQNRILNAHVDLSQNIPEITKTVTLTQPKRNIFYFGIQSFGNKENLPYAAGVTFDLKLRNDAMIGVGGYLTQVNPMYSFGMKFPIRLRKK